MAKNEAKVKVKLDTTLAERSLANLKKKGGESAKRIGKNIRGEIASGFGLGTGIGAGIAAARGVTTSGIGDVVGEAFGGIGAKVSEFFLGDLDEKARADKSAREETIQAFGAIAGQSGKVPPAAQNFFNQVRSLRLNEEKGRELFERDDRFRSSSATDLIERIMSGVGEMVSSAVDALADKLNPFK